MINIMDQSINFILLQRQIQRALSSLIVLMSYNDGRTVFTFFFILPPGRRFTSSGLDVPPAIEKTWKCIKAMKKQKDASSPKIIHQT